MLTDATIRAAKPLGNGRELELSDKGGIPGLRLVVGPTGAKIWRLRYSVQRGTSKKRDCVTLGHYPDLPLGKARIIALELAERIRGGHDPKSERRAGESTEDPTEDPTPAPAKHRTIAELVDGYIGAHTGKHSEAWAATTARTYRSALRRFTSWTELERLAPEDLSPADLERWREHAIRLPRTRKRRGGTRHEIESTGEPRSAAAVNGDLRAVKTALLSLRAEFPALSRETIGAALSLARSSQPLPEILTPEQIGELLGACIRHDAARAPVLRYGTEPAGASPVHAPIGPLVLVTLLAGCRLGEALAMRWSDVHLGDRMIRVLASKTGRERIVDLDVSPGLERLLAALREQARARGERDSALVFGAKPGELRGLPRHTARTSADARLRLIAEYSAPAFHWSARNSRPGERSAPTLRSTCEAYLVNAPGIYQGASLYRSAMRLGHSPDVAQAHYLNLVRNIDPAARTLGAAMRCESEIAELVAMVKRSD